MSETSQELREGVKEAYSAAAESPEGRHPFPVGREFAESVGYTGEWLELAGAAVFAGVSNVGVTAPVEPGMTVLDVGCGAGLDSAVMARRMGGHGRVLGLDFSEEMLRKAAGTARVKAGAESMPLRESSVDLAVVNGIFNLNPFRTEIFRELARVVKPGGRVYGAELVLKGELSVTFQAGRANWFS